MARSPLTRASVCPGMTVKDTSCRVSRLQGRVGMVRRPAALPAVPSISRAATGPCPSPAQALFPGSGRLRSRDGAGRGGGGRVGARLLTDNGKGGCEMAKGGGLTHWYS